MSEPFLGQIQPFAFNFAPRGWTKCDGQLLQISQYSALFSLLGTTYGGDGRTTFGLPDLRGRTSIHQGTGAGLSARSMGQKSGTETNTLAVANLPAHSHPMQARAEPATSNKPTGNLLGAGQQIYEPGAQDTEMSNQSIGNTGNGQAVNNMQPFLVNNWCIALVGIFPPRN